MVDRPVFEFATATRIGFGAGKLAEVAPALRSWGARRVLVVTGRDQDRARALTGTLTAEAIQVVTFGTPGEPTVELARAGVVAATGCDAVVAFGGGSALDAGKAIAALVANGGDPLDYLEVVGRGQPLTSPSLPFIAIPTTAGTGAEVTRNAVLAAGGVKASLRSPHMLPRLAIVDPELLRGLPAGVIAASGMDALSQVIEPFLSARANPLSDALAREGIRRSARSLRRAYTVGLDDPAVRDDLALTSLYGGLCLANAGLGAVHGFAAPAGGMLAAPHGALCAALLVPSLQINRQALEARAPSHPSLARLRELAALLTGRPEATVDEGLAFLDALRRDLAIPGLARHGLTEREIPALVAKAKAASSMKANPISLTDDELGEIARRALG